MERMSRRIHGVDVVGLDVDPETRCGHYPGPTDVIAIKFKCCDTWYPCIDCHRAFAGHEEVVWPVDEHDEKAVLCGVCGTLLAVREYLDNGSICAGCGARFNPGCGLHHHLYFELPSRTARHVTQCPAGHGLIRKGGNR